MRICFVNMPIEYYSTASGGAISTIIRSVAGELRVAGHDVDIVSYIDESNPPAERVTSMGDFRARSLTQKIGGRIGLRSPAARYRRDVTDALGALDAVPHAVIVFNDYTSTQWLRGANPGAKICVWLQNDQPVPENFDWSAVDLVLACSDYIRGRAVDRGAPAERCHTALSGVDLIAYVPRSEWLAQHEPTRVLCIGRLDPNKGHDVAISAVAALQREGHSVSVSLAGAKWWYGDATDVYVDSLLRSLDEVGGDYLGLVSRANLPDVVASHDVCLVLSRSEEPFGLVVLEAMAAGLAVVATTRGGLPQACGGAALALVEPDDIRSVLEALHAVIGPDGADTLSDAKVRSRARAEQAPWSVTADAVLAAIQRS